MVSIRGRDDQRHSGEPHGLDGVDLVLWHGTPPFVISNESVEKRISRSNATAANSELRIFLEGRGAMMCEDACGSSFSFSIA